LQQLLQLVAWGPDDLLVSVGDLVDRGPRSWDVVRFFRDTPNAHSVLGNHDRRLAGAVRGRSLPAWTQQHTLSQMDKAQWDEWASYLEALPAVIETPHAIVTHARLDGAVGLDAQIPYFTAGVHTETDGIPVDDDGVPAWFRSGDWAKPVCIGHLAYSRLDLVPGCLFALDTGAADGDCLTAVVFPGGEIRQVKAARCYRDEAFREWQRHALPATPQDCRLSDVARWMTVSANDDESLLTWRASLHAALDALRLDERAAEIRGLIEVRFGPRPDPGPARGDYARKVKACLPDEGERRLAGVIVDQRRLDISVLDRIERHVTIGGVDQLLDRVRERLAESGAATGQA
jgi:serine/threonine protein phosphatase 1